MKKIALFILATGLLLSAVNCVADTNGGFFVSARAGMSNLDHGGINDSDTEYGGNVGYRWLLVPAVQIGAEVGYTDLGKFNNKPGVMIPSQVGFKGFSAGINGRFSLSQDWYLSARLGVVDAELFQRLFTSDKLSRTQIVPYVGVGVGYDLNKNVSVALAYDFYQDLHKFSENNEFTALSAIAEYRF